MTALVLTLVLGCHEPPADTLRTDREGLAKRMNLPSDATDLRWITRTANAAKKSGRADQRVFAWVEVGNTGRDELASWLGQPEAGRPAYVPKDVADLVLPTDLLTGLSFSPTKHGYKLEGERYHPEALGRADYRGTAAVLVGDHLYVALVAH